MQLNKCRGISVKQLNKNRKKSYRAIFPTTCETFFLFNLNLCDDNNDLIIVIICSKPIGTCQI